MRKTISPKRNNSETNHFAESSIANSDPGSVIALTMCVAKPPKENTAIVLIKMNHSLVFLTSKAMK